MGLWRGIAYLLDEKMAQEADRRQNEYNQQFGGGYRGPGLFSGWAAARWGRAYWQDNQRIQQANSPFNGTRNVVTGMLESARGRCPCGDPNCRYAR